MKLKLVVVMSLRFDDFTKYCEAPPNEDDFKDSDTVIYPLVQMGPLDVHFDELALSSLLENAQQNSTIYLASGYFNLTQEYS